MRPARSHGNRQRWPRHGRKPGVVSHIQPAPVSTGVTSDRCESDCPGGTRLSRGSSAGTGIHWCIYVYIFSEASPNKGLLLSLAMRTPAVPRFLPPRMVAGLGRCTASCQRCLLLFSDAAHVCYTYLTAASLAHLVTHVVCPVIGWADSSAPTVALVCLLVRDLTPGHRRAVQVLGSIPR